MLESSSLYACVEYSFDGASVTEGYLLNCKDNILEICCGVCKYHLWMLIVTGWGVHKRGT